MADPKSIVTDAQLDRIIERLFTSGGGGRAARLVLVDAANRDLGGWCPGAIRDVIREEIDRG